MSAIAIALLAAALVPCEQTANYAPTPNIAEVFNIGTDCGRYLGSDRKVICRRVDGLRTTSVFYFALRAYEQGWREIKGSHGVPNTGSNFDESPGTIWFERPISADCSQPLTIKASPSAPEQPFSIAVFISDDYQPVCGAERQAQ